MIELKSMFSGYESKNLIDGKIKLKDELVATLHGKWDGEIKINDKYYKESILWTSNKETKLNRLKRFNVAFDNQLEHESEKLWFKVSQAIRETDQIKATDEKCKIEATQREKQDERESNDIEYMPKMFKKSGNEWIYKYLE